MSCKSRLEVLQQVFDEMFFESVIDGNCVKAYDISNTPIARIELNEDGTIKNWMAGGPVSTYKIQGMLAAMRYWWKGKV